MPCSTTLWNGLGRRASPCVSAPPDAGTGLGSRRGVQGFLVWTLDAGDTQRPRKQDGAEWDLDMRGSNEARAHAIRNAWQSR
eukprot:2200709-Alexandrium_andersonii.AAC.1